MLGVKVLDLIEKYKGKYTRRELFSQFEEEDIKHPLIKKWNFWFYRNLKETIINHTKTYSRDLVKAGQNPAGEQLYRWRVIDLECP